MQAAKSRDLDAAEGGYALVPPLDTSALHSDLGKPRLADPSETLDAETLAATPAALDAETLPENPDGTLTAHPDKTLDGDKAKAHARPPMHPIKASEPHRKLAPFATENGGQEKDTISAVAKQLHAADGHANGVRHAPASPFEEASQQVRATFARLHASLQPAKQPTACTSGHSS